MTLTDKQKTNWKRKIRSFLQPRLSSMKNRCNSIKSCGYAYYGGKGVKCLIEMDELEFLWHRDNGASLKRPSIDRIDSNGNYEIQNCRFIELSENVKRREFPNRVPKRKFVVVRMTKKTYQSIKESAYKSMKNMTQYILSLHEQNIKRGK